VAFRKNAKIELLQRTPLFAGCSKRELGEIATIADEVDIPAGTDFIREGEPGREFFALIEGTVEVRRNGRRVKVKGGSEFFGEISLISATPRNATVTAASPVRALVITGPAFAGLLRRLPGLQLKVLRSLAERVAPDESL
jgi:CRP/FNR family transcriptional regulator, cyclic AMP receptor protein